MLIDTHCHLYFKELKKDIPGIIKRAKKMGVTRFICVGTNLEDSSECLKLSENYDNIYSTVGIHPHDAKNAPKDFVDRIIKLKDHDRVVAIGEMGLDYYRNISSPEKQKQIFRSQIAIAKASKKPIILHNRNADKDVINILSDFPDVIGVAHCFSSNLETAKALLNLGYYISFSGNLTFKNSLLPSVAEELPLERILVETDSPFLSPVPFRGRLNEPGRTRLVAEKLGSIHKVPFEQVAKITTENAMRLFNLSNQIK
tara:strand:+ start:8515 stop:9285 length:771 start_codon:yes stop_codon:yes gene_type:complete